MPFDHTRAQYARHRGCSERAVDKQVQKGRITCVLVDGRQMFNPQINDAEWAQTTRARGDSARKPGATPPAAPGAVQAAGQQQPAYNDHRARREQAEADMAELERDRLAGRLVLRERAEKAVFDAFRVLRDACMRSHADTALCVLNQADPREVRFILDDGYRAAFESAEKAVAGLLVELAKP